MSRDWCWIPVWSPIETSFKTALQSAIKPGSNSSPLTSTHQTLRKIHVPQGGGSSDKIGSGLVWTLPYYSLISFDASKAFDRVPHNLLIERLKSCPNIPQGFINWYTNYLSNRFQYVSIDDNNSKHSLVSSGVPQGAILSPSIFCVYLAPLQPVTNISKLFKFADDFLFVLLHSENDSNESDCEREATGF